jgi:DNA polymerase-3 subunit beta
MEFSISRNTLQKELGFVQGIVERKNTIPILSNIVIESVGENTIRIIATDLDVTLRCDAEAESIVRPGALCVQARKLFDVARLLPDAPVHFRKEDNDWVSVTCGTAKFKLSGAPRENFPELPESKSVPIKIPSEVMKDFISRSIFAITQEESRYTLSGAKFVLDGTGAKMITTDGHRLAYIATLLPVQTAGEEKIDTLIPRKALAEMTRLTNAADGEVQMGADDNHIYFEVGPRLLISRLLSGQFPNYEMVMPKNNDKTVIFDGAELNKAVRLVATMADERSHSIRLQLETGTLKISAQTAEQGEGQQVLEANYEGPEISIGFNAQYLQEFLSVMGDTKVAIDFKDGNSQAQLRPVDDPAYDCKYVVMPMRI